MYKILPNYLSNSAALNRLRLHLGEVVVVGDDIRNDGLLIRVVDVHIYNQPPTITLHQ